MTQAMQAVAIDRFGGPDVLKVVTIPIPALEAGEVRIRLEWAGIGEWDPFEREGGYAEMMGISPRFPYVLGSEGAGVIDAVGGDAEGFRKGDRVYSPAFLNPKGGFYAEYAVVPAALVAHVPPALPTVAAAAIGGVGLTALRGLEDVLHVQ